MQFTYKIVGVALSAFAVALPAGGVHAAAFAIGFIPPAGARAAASNPFAAQIKELHGIKILLERADHDYQGHRAAAVKDITSAIHALRAGAPRRPHAGKASPKGKQEPQKLSDAQLKAAIDLLGTITTQLSGSQDPRAAKAVTAIQKAEKELQIALTIK
jgi:hypothetical protein